MPDQCLRRRNLLAAERMLELQRVHRRLRLEMIVGDYVGRLGLARDYLNFLFPFLQLRRLIQIVVAVVPIVAVEPLIVVAAMKAHVPNTRCYVLSWRERVPEQRLIDVAEANILSIEPRDRLRIIPAVMTHLDHSWILAELPQQLLQVFPVQTGVFE